MMLYSEHWYPSSDGLHLYYRDYGGAPDRTPVLCIPGLTRNCRDFDLIAAHIACTRRVLCVDLRGRGRSAYDANWRNYSVPIERSDIIQLLASTGIRRVIVLGTSRGAIVAMALAAAQREYLGGVILNDLGAQLNATGLGRIMALVGSEIAFGDWDEAANCLKQTYQDSFIGIDE